MAFSPKITSEALNQLLAALSDDKVAAGFAYTKLRESLIRFFQIKGDSDPDDSADETLDRVALKISQNTEIPDLTKFSFGVARFVFLERIKLDQKQRIAAKGFYADKISIKPEVETDDFSPLRECFNHLADDEKQILQEYFADIPHLELFEQRKKMQIKYDIGLSSLRVKIFRLRERLENCLKEKSAK
jgi:DNA-directed RNA polymerase specialized sigma24 family protein